MPLVIDPFEKVAILSVGEGSRGDEDSIGQAIRLIAKGDRDDMFLIVD